VRTGASIRGFVVGTVVYGSGGVCECVAACKNHSECVAIVHNREQDPPNCRLKSVADTYERGDKDVLFPSLAPPPPTSPSAPPPPQPPPPPPGAATPLRFATCGRAGRCSESARWAVPSELHEVRCCSETKLGSTWRRWGGCSVWSESDGAEMGGCHHEKNFTEAEAICSAAGARLCTTEELEGNCARGTGCGHDSDLIWSGSLSASLPPPAAPLSPPAGLYECAGDMSASCDAATPVRPCAGGSADAEQVEAGGAIWLVDGHRRGSGVPEEAQLDVVKVGCEADCVCLCLVTESCFAFDYREANNECRRYNAAVPTTDVPCEKGQHYWHLVDAEPAATTDLLP